MTNNFLMVNKDLFGCGLSPIEILITAQIMEYQRTTGDCFISDSTLADLFGVSSSTVSRALAALEKRGILYRETKNIKGGKERHMCINIDEIESLHKQHFETCTERDKHQFDYCQQAK